MGDKRLRKNENGEVMKDRGGERSERMSMEATGGRNEDQNGVTKRLGSKDRVRNGGTQN